MKLKFELEISDYAGLAPPYFLHFYGYIHHKKGQML